MLAQEIFQALGCLTDKTGDQIGHAVIKTKEVPVKLRDEVISGKKD